MFETNKTKTAFITKVKSQKVRILIGKVKIINIGLTKVFRTPRTTATIIAVTKFSTLTPGKIYEVAKTAKLFRRR